MMKTSALLLLCMLGIALTAAKPTAALTFCERNPTHWKCASPTPTPTPTPSPTPTPVPTVTPAPTPGSVPRVLFGQGPEADGVLDNRLYLEAPVNMLTSWYNGSGDLAWMPGWEDDLVPQAYARGEALHLIVWSDIPEVSLSTAYGPACGRAYPLSDRFLDDMAILAHTFRPRDADDRFYVTMWSEFQTFACTDNAWAPNVETTNYWRALKDRYLEVVDVFRAVGGKVSLGWGGWQARFDQPTIGGGRSMFQHFADVMNASDFQSFQAMQSDSNVTDVATMTATLAPYTGGVMLAHHKPDNGSQATFDADVRAMLTDSYLAARVADGLFAWSFMDDSLMVEPTYSFVRDAVRRYGAP